MFKSKMQGSAAKMVKNATRESYDSYIAALKDGLYETQDRYRQILTSRRQKEGESLATLSLDLAGIADQAYGVADSSAKATALRDAFLNAILNPKVRRRVRDLNPANLKEAEETAKRLAFNEQMETGLEEGVLRDKELSKKVEKTKPVREVTEMESQMVKRVAEMEEKLRKMETMEKGTQKSGSPQPSKNKGNRGRFDRRNRSGSRDSGNRNFKSKGPFLCYHCGFEGHMARNCPESRQGGRYQPSRYYPQEYQGTGQYQYQAPIQAAPAVPQQGNCQGQNPAAPGILPQHQ